MPADTTKVFLNRMLVVFLARVSPDSSVANPRCMMNTKAAAIIIQRLLVVNISALTPSSAAKAWPAVATSAHATRLSETK